MTPEDVSFQPVVMNAAPITAQDESPLREQHRNECGCQPVLADPVLPMPREQLLLYESHPLIRAINLLYLMQFQ